MTNVSSSDAGMDNDEPVFVAETGKRVQNSPAVPAKRLKQARLPFMKISSPTIKTADPLQKIHLRKRQLSNSENEDFSPVVDNGRLESEQAKVYGLKKTLVVLLTDCKENKSPTRSLKKCSIPKKSISDKTKLLVHSRANLGDSRVESDAEVEITYQSVSSEERESKNDNPALSNNIINGEPLVDKNGTESLPPSTSVIEKGFVASSTIEVETVDTEKLSFDTGSEPVNALPTIIDINLKIPSLVDVNHSLDTIDQASSQKKKRSKVKSNPVKSLQAEKAKLEKLKTELENVQKNEAPPSAVQNEPLENIVELKVPFSIEEGKQEQQLNGSFPTEAIGEDSFAVEGTEVLSRSLIKSTLDKKSLLPAARKKKFTKVKRSVAKEDLEKERQKQEKLKVQLEIEKLKAELRKQKEDAKQQREKGKALAVAKKLQEKQAKKEQEEREKEEKRKREEVAREEKLKRDEATRAKLEEKRKKLKEKQDKEEEKKKVEEDEERKKNKVKAAFASFFLKKDLVQNSEIYHPGHFLPFQVKENTRLAPLYRNIEARSVERVQMLDTFLKSQASSSLYLEEIRGGKITLGRSSKTWPMEDKDVEVLEFNNGVDKKKHLRAKLLQFSENVRPPYYGTWRKKSKVIGPRRPFQRDVNFFDYDLDSEEEWEEEEPGESLSHTEDEKESEDEYEVDNEFFVPHGYLSAEEDQDEDGVAMSPDAFKAQLRIKETEFENEMKQKCQKIQPTMLGCFWTDDVQAGNEELMKVLNEFSAVVLTSCPIDTTYCLQVSANESEQSSTGTPLTVSPVICEASKTTQSTTKTARRLLPDEVIPAFIRLVHGLQFGQKVIYHEFGEYFRTSQRSLSDSPSSAENDAKPSGEDLDKTAADTVCSLVPQSENAITSCTLKLGQSIPKSVMKRTLKEIATWNRFPEKGPLFGEFAWFVRKEIREKYKLMELPIPNQWRFHTEVETLSPQLSVSAKKLKGEKPTGYFKSKLKKVPFEKFLEQIGATQQQPNDKQKDDIIDLTTEKNCALRSCSSIDDQSQPLNSFV